MNDNDFEYQKEFSLWKVFVFNLGGVKAASKFVSYTKACMIVNRYLQLKRNSSVFDVYQNEFPSFSFIEGEKSYTVAIQPVVYFPAYLLN